MILTDLTTTHLPPGPTEAYDMQTSAETFARLEEWLPRYGDLLRVKPVMRKNPAFVINHPDYLKQVLVSNNTNYHKGVGFERVKMLLGNGIIVSDGPFWRRQRRMVQPAFDRSVIAVMSEQFSRLNLRLLDKWQVLAEQHATINITEATNDLALEIILHAIFSEDIERIVVVNGGNPFAFLVADTTRDLKLVVKFRALTKLIAEVIAQRRQRGAVLQDFLGIMLAARDKETGAAMQDKELIDEVMTLIVAGSETSATTMNWTWYAIAQYPEIATQFYAEIDAASYFVSPSFEHIAELTYTRQIVEEALRIYPPVWLYTRKAIGDDTLGAFNIPAGADIFISPYYLHRNSAFWPDPDRFDPTRFSEAAVKARHKLAYIPFSAGPRRCIGDFFGIVEAQMHFGLMGRHFNMEYFGTTPPPLAPEVNLRSKQPLLMRITKR